MVDKPDVRLLESTLANDIKRDGPMSSVLVRAGLLRDIINELQRYRTTPDLPERGGWRGAVETVFAEGLLGQAERLGLAPFPAEALGGWRDRVRKAALLALPPAPAG